MKCDGRAGIGAGDQDCAPRTFTDLHIDLRLDPQQRRNDGFMAARAQRRRGALGIGFGAGEKEPHAA